MSTCKKCGCEDKFLTPAPCPNPIGCSEPEPCSELFDAQCVQYNGEDIICGEETIVPTNTDLATALNSIADLACNPVVPVANKYVEISDTGENTATVALVNITGAVTYQWSFADNTGDFTFIGATNTNSITLLAVNPSGHGTPLADIDGIPFTSKAIRYMTLLKVKVTDAVGNVYQDKFFYIQLYTSSF